MWTTWRKAAPRPQPSLAEPSIRRVTNAYSGEPPIPDRGRHAAISVWMENLPPECDLNNLEILVDGARAIPIYIGPPSADGVQQFNAWLPQPVRTGLVPVEVLVSGQPFVRPLPPAIFPAGPVGSSHRFRHRRHQSGARSLLPAPARSKSRSKSWLRRSQSARRSTAVPMDKLDMLRTEPRPPRYELNLRAAAGPRRRASIASKSASARAGPSRLKFTSKPEVPRLQ